MVNILLSFVLFNLFLVSPKIEIDTLFISKYCSGCNEAKKLVSSNTVIIDIHEKPILANRYRIRIVPTLLTKNGQKLVGLTKIREYCNQYQQSSSYVLYFKGPDNVLTLGIKRRIKRLGFIIKIGTKQAVIDYKITHLPTFIFIENGKELGRYIGVKLYEK